MRELAAVAVTEEGARAGVCAEVPTAGVCPNAPEGAPCACAGMTLYLRSGPATAGHEGWALRVPAGTLACPLWVLSSFPYPSMV